MKIDRRDTLTMNSPPETSFSGHVKIGGYFRRARPSRVAGAMVEFEAGSRTPWKVNPLGQTIIIISGTGWVHSAGGKISKVRPGDVIWFEPNEQHWEGATPTEGMTYFAIQEEDFAGVIFGTAVTDEEYGNGHTVDA
jgi:quercetin dioxygenase-like cupin family protein